VKLQELLDEFRHLTNKVEIEYFEENIRLAKVPFLRYTPIL